MPPLLVIGQAERRLVFCITRADALSGGSYERRCENPKRIKNGTWQTSATTESADTLSAYMKLEKTHERVQTYRTFPSLFGLWQLTQTDWALEWRMLSGRVAYEDTSTQRSTHIQTHTHTHAHANLGNFNRFKTIFLRAVQINVQWQYLCYFWSEHFWFHCRSSKIWDNSGSHAGTFCAVFVTLFFEVCSYESSRSDSPNSIKCTYFS